MTRVHFHCVWSMDNGCFVFTFTDRESPNAPSVFNLTADELRQTYEDGRRQLETGSGRLGPKRPKLSPTLHLGKQGAITFNGGFQCFKQVVEYVGAVYQSWCAAGGGK